MITKEKYKKYFIIILVLFVVNCGTASASLLDNNKVHLGPQEGQMDKFNEKAGFTPATTVGDVIAYMIGGFLAVLGVIFIILIILAGFNWMTAAGEEEKIRKAKDTLKRAIIGLFIIIAAYAITHFVFKYLGGGNDGPGILDLGG